MPSIRDFSGGVLNQELQNKDGGAGLLFDCKNVLSSWNGELRKRTGTKYQLSLDEYSRIIPYRMPGGNDVVLALHDNTITGYEFGGDSLKPLYIYSGEGPAFPTSGWNGQTTNGDYTIFINGNNDNTQWGKGFDTPVKTRPMTWYGKGARWINGYSQTTEFPAYIQISSAEEQLLNCLTIRWTYTVPGNRTGTYKGWIEPVLQYSDDGTNWTSIETIMENPVPFGGADMYQASYHYGSGSSEKTENHTVYKVTNANHSVPHKYWRVYCATRINNHQHFDGERIDLNVYDIAYLSTTKSQFVVNTTNNFNITLANADNIKFAQNGNLMILTNGEDKPFYIRYSGGAFSTGTYTMSIREGQGNPACVWFYQNRLWFGGYSAFPTRVWGSAFGNFTDFMIPETVLKTSAIMADAVEIQSRIENMWGGNNALYCLSEDGVSMIDAQGGIVATDQIEFKLRNREPANSMTPTYKDDIMVYLGRNKRKILITDYDYVVQRFKAQNISNGYTDFLQSGIRELHYIPDNASLIYGLLENGQWFVLLFDIDSGKNAIYPFEIDGAIYDIQPMKYNAQTRLLLVTQRSGKFFLEEKITINDQERMDFMSIEEKQNYTRDVIAKNTGYLDCMIKRTFETGTDYVGDLPYNASTMVDVIADGAYLGKKELNPAISGSMFAWSFGDDVVYTNTETPSSSSILYNRAQEEDTNHSIVELHSNYIKIRHSEEVSFYGFGFVPSISVTTSGATPAYSGEFQRYPEIDKYYASVLSGALAYLYGWKQNDVTIKTGWPHPVVGNSYATNLPGYEDVYIFDTTRRKVSAVSDTQMLYVREKSGDKVAVYDSSFNIIGNADIKTDPKGLGYFEFNGKTYYNFDVYNKKQVIDIVEDYYRNPAKDLSAQGVGLQLDFPVKEVVIGYPYDSYAVIKFVSPYNLRKFPKEISVNFINSGYIELGNTFETLKPCLNNLVENVILNNKPILLNGNYTMTFDKHAFETPYVIVRSDKGLPFIITGMDYKVDTSNYQGGI